MPVAVATAIYVTELCPGRVRAPVTVLIELLAAVPSVVYGLWGIFFLAPKLVPAEQWIADRLSFVPFVGGGIVTIPNIFVAGLILAIMILPIVSAISREVMATVPSDHKEAALGLGATRWEMIRLAVLPYCRSGHHRRGDARPRPRDRRDDRGDDPDRRRTADAPAPVRPGLLARRGDRQRVRRGDQGLHRSALFAAGLVLFVLTLIVNAIARLLVLRAARARARGRSLSAPRDRAEHVPPAIAGAAGL